MLLRTTHGDDAGSQVEERWGGRGCARLRIHGDLHCRRVTPRVVPATPRRSRTERVYRMPYGRGKSQERG
jgi:hypothetical protein